MIYPMVPFPATLSDTLPRFQGHGVIFMPIDALSVSCAQLTRDLLAIAKFLFIIAWSKLDYGWIVYGSARCSYLRMLDPIQNHALRLCLGAYRTSPASSLCVEANEPPVYLRRKKLSLQCCLKLSCNYNNPAYATVFNSKFHSVFERKPTQLPPLAIRVSGDLQAVGLKKSDVIISSIPTTPPWLLTRTAVNFTLHCSDESNTPPEIFKHRFYELCHEFKNYYLIFTDGSKEGNRVAAAVVHQDNSKCVRLPDTASIFRAELYALLAIDVHGPTLKRKEFCNLFLFHVKSAIYLRL